MEWYEKVLEEPYDRYNYCVVSQHGSMISVEHKTVTNSVHDFTNIWTVDEDSIPWHLRSFFAPKTAFRIRFKNGVEKICSRLTGEQILLDIKRDRE